MSDFLDDHSLAEKLSFNFVNNNMFFQCTGEFFSVDCFLTPRLYIKRVRLWTSLMATIDMCRAAATSGNIKLTTLDESFNVPVEFNERHQFMFDSGAGTRNTVFCYWRQVKLNTIKALLKRLILIFYGTTEVFNTDAWLLLEARCKNSSLYYFVYNWNTLGNCVETQNLERKEELFLMCLLTAEEKKNCFSLAVSSMVLIKRAWWCKLKLSQEASSFDKTLKSFKKSSGNRFAKCFWRFAEPNGKLRTDGFTFKSWESFYDIFRFQLLTLCWKSLRGPFWYKIEMFVSLNLEK